MPGRGVTSLNSLACRLLDGAEFEALVADIRANGLRAAITRHPDGSILDGRNRDRACRAAGVAPRFVEWDGNGTPQAFVVSMNLARRHLDEGQRAMVAAKLANLEHGGDRSKGPIGTMKISEAAKVLNVSERSVKRAKRVIAKGSPELVAAVERGEVAVSRAAATVAPPRPAADDNVVALAPPKPCGPPLRIADDTTPEAWVRGGMAREGDETSAAIAKSLGLDIGTYRKIRWVVLLAARADLLPDDRRVAAAALAALNRTRRIAKPFAMIETLRRRIYGETIGLVFPVIPPCGSLPKVARTRALSMPM